jgi:hypothetical protein
MAELFIKFKYLCENSIGIESYKDIKECRDDHSCVAKWVKGKIITVVEDRNSNNTPEYSAKYIKCAGKFSL